MRTMRSRPPGTASTSRSATSKCSGLHQRRTAAAVVQARQTRDDGAGRSRSNCEASHPSENALVQYRAAIDAEPALSEQQQRTKTFTEVSPLTRLAYLSLIDFVPDDEPYEHLTVVDMTPADNRTKVVMSVDPMHDEAWTQRILAGRHNELDNLQAAIARRA